MNNPNLGRLEPVNLRDHWTNEQIDFTPWLALPENLEILSETLGIKLKVDSAEVEKAVGPFRADILCKDIGTDTESWVLIENQLGKTDHDHLGKLLTYAAGLNVVTIVWLAAPFTDEHRAALDWLNEITQEDFRFFGLEIELWRIGNSLAAPKFNIVSQPNDWSQSVARRAKSGDDAGLSENRLKQKKYWTEFKKIVDATNGPISGNPTPKAQNSIWYGIGNSGFGLLAIMNSKDNSIRVEIHIYGDNAKERFGRLEQQKEKIEHEFGDALEWRELPTNQESQIAYYLHDADPWDETDWPQQHGWLAEQLNKMHSVFSGRVKNL